MNARKADAVRAQEVLEVIQEVRDRVSAFNITEDLFLNTDSIEMRMMADSLLMCALRITEEAGKLSDDAKRKHPEIDWRGITGMRNFLAHDYSKVNRAMVWTAVTEEFVELEKACRVIAAE